MADGAMNLALVPTMLFFALDAYYLAAEQAYRGLDNAAATQTSAAPMTIAGGTVTPGGWLGGALQPATWSVYLVLALAAIAIGARWLVLDAPGHP